MHPESHYARSIFELSSWMLCISLGIFLLVTGLVTYARWRFRARPGERDPKQVFGRSVIPKPSVIRRRTHCLLTRSKTML